MNESYFGACTDLSQLKRRYHALVVEHHPDLGGDTATMQEVNAEYERLFHILKDRQNAEADEAQARGERAWRTDEDPAEFRAVIDRLVRIPGIRVEICGAWVWIDGDEATYRARGELKAAGCRWSRSKQKWYWRPAYMADHRSRGAASMDDIRRKYGSRIVAAEDEARQRRELIGAALPG